MLFNSQMLNTSKINRRVALGLLGGAAASLSALPTAHRQDATAQLVIRQTPSTGYLGLNVGTELNWQSWRDQLLPLYRAAGVTWLRVWYNWAQLEPSPGAYGDELTIESLRLAKRLGFRLLFVIWGMPSHAGRGGLNAVPRSSALSGYCQWLRENLSGLVNAWEVGNEPNLRKYYVGSAAEYVRTLATAYEVLQGSGKLVIAAGPSGAATATYWQSLLDRGLERHCDRVNLHPYRTRPENAVRLVDQFLDRVRKPVWITELGLDAEAEGEAAKAAFVRAVLPQLATRVEKVFWYRGLQGEGLHPLNFGLIEADRETRRVTTLPAYDALVAYARQPLRP
jgi:hypothetical protein